MVAAILFFIFGGKKIPEFFKGISDAVKEFKKASKEPEKEEKGDKA